MTIHCILACRDRAGWPDFCAVSVECTQAQYDNGDHYDAARAWADEQGYEGPYVVYDRHDGPDWLFDQAHLREPEGDVVSIVPASP